MVLPDKIRVAARAGYVDIVSKWLDSDAAHDVNDVAAAADDPRVRGCGLLFSALQYPMPGHDGDFWWSGAYGTHLWISPATGTVLVVMQQQQRDPAGGDDPIVPYLLQAVVVGD